MNIDIVIPIYNEEENLPELYSRLSNVFQTCSEIDFRVIYINDGSKDSSVAKILEQNNIDSRFTLIELSRNFGHQAAITAGLAYSSADAVIIMDGDLQDPPEVIPELIRAWKDGAQVILAKRRSRKETGLRRIAFDSFHAIFKFMSDTPIEANAGVFGLMDRQVVTEFNEFSENNRFIPGLRSWIGFDQKTVYYDRDNRAAGDPKQSFKRLIKYGLDAIFSFSYKPLRLFTFIGIFICVIGLSLACFFLTRRILGIETAQTGFTTLVLLILIFGGFQFVLIGVLGEYIARIYDEVKHRPLFIVKRVHGVTESTYKRKKVAHLDL
jgi:polyisoprenyl-phosphate glycosyltransferase